MQPEIVRVGLCTLGDVFQVFEKVRVGFAAGGSGRGDCSSACRFCAFLAGNGFQLFQMVEIVASHRIYQHAESHLAALLWLLMWIACRWWRWGGEGTAFLTVAKGKRKQ
jgi:hypothetical protein